MTTTATTTSTSQLDPAVTSLPAEVILTETDHTLWKATMKLAQCVGLVMAAEISGGMNESYKAVIRKCFNRAGQAFLGRGEQFNDAVAWHLISESRIAADLMGDLGLLTPSQEVANQRQPVLEAPDMSDPVWVLMNYMLTFGRQTCAAVAVAGTAEGEEYASAATDTCNEVFEWLDGRPLPKGTGPLVVELLSAMQGSLSMLLESDYELSIA